MVEDSRTQDGSPRIPTSALPTIALRHLISAIDRLFPASDDNNDSPQSATGYTEWVGMWNDTPVWVAWDWTLVRGVVVIHSPNEIRTNVGLVTDDDRDEPLSLQKIFLMEWIETTDWRETAIHPILEKHGFSQD